MHTPLLTTKLYRPPPRANLVARPRLLQKLDYGLREGHRLTLVSAPAGYGKTTLLTEWLSTQPHRAVWLSLDEADNDPARFWAHVILALQGIHDELGEAALVELRSPQPPPVQWLLPDLLNEIASLQHPTLLVLDDYHVISAMEVHDALAFSLEHLPPVLQLVLATRSDPPLPLARLRARDQLSEVRAADLRFTPEEVEAFLNQVMGLRLAAEHIALLEERTEGWIAGLHLAALSMQGRDAESMAQFIATFSGQQHVVLDYLTDEVLKRQAEPIQTFLLRTSILDRMCAPLCDALLTEDRFAGRTPETRRGQATKDEGDSSLVNCPSSASVLEYLEHANLFLVPLDDQCQWYRYHHLFADLLRRRLQHAVSATELANLHSRASEWYEQSESPTEAVKHALTAQDFERAARLIERWTNQIRAETPFTTFLNWIHRFPADMIGRRARLCIVYAWALLGGGQLETIEGLLHAAEEQIQTGMNPDAVPSETEELSGHIAALRTYLALFRGDAASTAEHARSALQRFPETALELRARVSLQLGEAYWMTGELSRAVQPLRDAARLGQLAGDLHTFTVAYCRLANLYKVTGQLHAAADAYREIHELLDEKGSLDLPAAGMLQTGQADLLRERNDLEGARQLLTKAIPNTQRWRPYEAIYAYIAQARVLQAQGDLNGALVTLHEAEPLVRRYAIPPPARVSLESCQVRLWLAAGDLLAAMRWMEDKQVRVGDDLSYPHELENMARARVLMAQRKPDEGGHLLARLERAAETAGRNGRLIEILALQALAYQAQNKHARALALLAKSLSLAEPEDYCRVFLDEGPEMANLLQAAAKEEIAVDYIGKLLTAFSGAATQPAGAAPESEYQAPRMLAESLTARELEVLRFLAEGFSNREIAQKLYLSPNTLRSYTYSIYCKLRVHSRMQAVARARAQGLIPRS